MPIIGKFKIATLAVLALNMVSISQPMIDSLSQSEKASLRFNEIQIVDGLDENNKGVKRLLYQDTRYEYTDSEVYRLVSPVWKSKALMTTKGVLKIVSGVAIGVGAWYIFSSPTQSFAEDSGGDTTGKYVTRGVLIGGAGVMGIVLQIPLTKLSIDIFNSKQVGG